MGGTPPIGVCLDFGKHSDRHRLAKSVHHPHLLIPEELLKHCVIVESEEQLLTGVSVAYGIGQPPEVRKTRRLTPNHGTGYVLNVITDFSGELTKRPKAVHILDWFRWSFIPLG